MPRSLTGDLLRVGFALGLGLAATASYTAIRVVQQGERDERSEPADAIVVMGAAHYDGRPSPVFRARLDHAIELYREGRAPVLVVTGGRAEGDDESEASVARRYAHERGVPDEAIVSESAGYDTLSSMRNVARIFREEQMERGLFVSDRTHMLRVLILAKDQGIQARGSPTTSSPVDRDTSARAGAVAHELGALAVYLTLGR